MMNITTSMGEKLTLQQQIARKEAQLAKLKNQQKAVERKNETRRLIYHGRLLEKFLATGVISRQQYHRALDELLTRNYDREFFGLSLRADEPKPKQKLKKKGDSPIEVNQAVSQEIITPAPPTIPQHNRLYEHSVSEAEFLT